MNFFKRLTALLLAAVLTIGLFPVNAYADEQETLTFHTTHINPYYADIISEEDLRPAAAPGRQTYDTPKYASTIEEAGAALRPHLGAREEIATVYYYTTEITNELF